jgi:RNA polymerase sigma-70 factor, ECF subfamily
VPKAKIALEPIAAMENEIDLLHEQHCPELMRYAYSISNCESVADDAVQEAFLRYFIERSYGREIANPRAWLYQVLRNYLSDRFNSGAAKREVKVEHLDRIAALSHDPEKLVQNTQTAREIAASLSRRELQCLRLRTEGLSYLEIGAAMEVCQGTVSALLTRAHEKLRKRADTGGFSLDLMAAGLGYLAQQGQAFTSG